VSGEKQAKKITMEKKGKKEKEEWGKKTEEYCATV